MTFRTEDGQGPPEDWTLAVCLPGPGGLGGGTVAIMAKGQQQLTIHTGSVEAAYWLACLINNGLGVDEEASS